MVATPRIYSFQDICAPRPPVEYAIDEILPMKSVSVFYGYPGSLKSFLVLDMLMAVATGNNFLPSMPNSQDTSPGYGVEKSSVLWIDFDNGTDVSFDREEAVGRCYGANLTTSFYHISLPEWKGINKKSIDSMIDLIKSIGSETPRVICFDTLLRFSGVQDENSSEMDQLMKSLRRIAEELSAAVIVISHSNKTNNGRAGNALRGHSSIEGGVDSVFRVSRDAQSDVIDIEQQKARRHTVKPFSARFTYKTKGNSRELEEARFYSVSGSGNVSATKQTNKQNDLEQLILETLENAGQKMSKNQICNSIKRRRTDIYQTLEKLERDLAVEKTNHPTNNTWFLYEITDLGRTLL